MTDKNMTVDEAVSTILNLAVQYGSWSFSGKECRKVLEQLIESQRAQAVEEYIKSQALTMAELRKRIEDNRDEIDRQDPWDDPEETPIKWLSLTYKQRDGEYWLVAGYRGGGIFDWDFAYFNTERGCFENKTGECLPFSEAYYAPIDQIPLPEKEDVELFFNDPENIEAIKEWDVCANDGLEKE